MQYVGGKKTKQLTSALSTEIDEMIEAQVNASNADLYAQCRKSSFTKIRG